MNSLSNIDQWEPEFVIPPTYMYNEKYAILNVYFSGRFIDRTNTINPGFKSKVITALPTSMPQSSDDFDVIADRTARNIHAQSLSNGLPILVLWSGGMDSTAVVCAFLRQNIPVVVTFNTFSIDENPWFYNDVLRNNELVTLLRTDKPIFFIHKHGAEYNIVTGECGAQLMGTISWEKFADTTRPHTGEIVATNATIDMFKSKHPMHGIPSIFRSLLLPIVDQSPRAFTCNYDYMWWITFVMKWQLMEYRIQLITGKLQPHFFNFFLTDEFAEWALVNDHRVKCPNFEWKNYKMPIRDYIYQYTNNRLAFEMKKIASMPRSHPEIAEWGSSIDTRCILYENDRLHMDIGDDDIINTKKVDYEFK